MAPASHDFFIILFADPDCTAVYPFTACPVHAYGVPGGSLTLKWDYKDIKADEIIFSIIQSHQRILEHYKNNTSKALKNYTARFELPATLIVDNITDEFSGNLRCQLLAENSSLYGHDVNMTLCVNEGELVNITWRCRKRYSAAQFDQCH